MGFTEEAANAIKSGQKTDATTLLRSEYTSIQDLLGHIETYTSIAQAPALREPLIDVLNGQSILVGKNLYSRNQEAPIGVIEKATRYESVVEITLKDAPSEHPPIRISTTAKADFSITHNGIETPLNEIQISIYKPRNPFLWGWCLVNAKLTTQQYLKSHLESDEKRFNEVTCLKLLMIMVNVMIDDMADQIQNKSLLNALTTYINKTLSRVQTEDMRTVLNTEKEALLDTLSVQAYKETFKDYLSFTTTLWQQTLETAQKLIPVHFLSFVTDLQQDYMGITQAMQSSIQMCAPSQNEDTQETATPWLFLEQNAEDLFQLERTLADNMNMMGFESVDAWVYAEDRLENKTAISEFMAKRTTYKQIFLPHLQFMAQTANHLSTGFRELADNDVSNALFLILANTGLEHTFDLDQLRLSPPLVQHKITERITRDLTTRHTYGELAFHWFTACKAIDVLSTENEPLAKDMHLAANLQNIKAFTVSYLKCIGKL